MTNTSGMLVAPTVAKVPKRNGADFNYMRSSTRNRLARHATVDYELTHVQPSHVEVVNHQGPHTAALQGDHANGKTPNGERSDRHRTERERSDRNRADGHPRPGRLND
jgi:hypothetical protein